MPSGLKLFSFFLLSLAIGGATGGLFVGGIRYFAPQTASTSADAVSPSPLSTKKTLQTPEVNVETPHRETIREFDWKEWKDDTFGLRVQYPVIPGTYTASTEIIGHFSFSPTSAPDYGLAIGVAAKEPGLPLEEWIDRHAHFAQGGLTPATIENKQSITINGRRAIQFDATQVMSLLKFPLPIPGVPGGECCGSAIFGRLPERVTVIEGPNLLVITQFPLTSQSTIDNSEAVSIYSRIVSSIEFAQ